MSRDEPFVPARDHAHRSLVAACPGCGRPVEETLGPHEGGAPPPASLRCGACGAARPLDFARHLDEDRRLDGCPVCGYHTLCIQKDVNARLGVVLVLVTWGALLFSGLAIPWLVAALAAVALADWALLRLVVKRLLICYRCKAQFRGWPPGGTCRPFDLATWEAHTPPSEG